MGGAARENRKNMNYDPPSRHSSGHSDTLRKLGRQKEAKKDQQHFYFQTKTFFLLVDTAMRWKSEVKEECCAVNDNENESLLSNDEVSNDNHNLCLFPARRR